MPTLPRAAGLDSTLSLLADPYLFISRECRRHGTDLFEARLLLKKAICVTGPDAAELFYDSDKFSRKGAMPEPVQATLLGKGGVQGLDAAEHLHRKSMIMSLMTKPRLTQMTEVTEVAWRASIRYWETQDEVVLYESLHPLLTAAVCAWAGVPLPVEELPRRSDDLALLFDAAAAKNLRHISSRLARKRCNAWAESLIEEVRSGAVNPHPNTALAVVARHRTLAGPLLDAKAAAVDLLNVLRPTVAVSVFITFVAHALQEHPSVAARLRECAPDDEYVGWFVQEVRRRYPFFPVAAARVRHDFVWRGYRFPAGRRVLFDLFGTDLDARTWDEPLAFRPERFRDWDGSPYDFVPQGGGDHFANHRCAGEWLTIELMKQAAVVLTQGMRYSVPAQDLSMDYTRLPALPRSHFRVRDVSLAAAG